MRIKTIVNNYISNFINENKFRNIYIYGSKYLQIEKLICKSTSSSIIGDDVDFCNTLLAEYYLNRDKKIILPEHVCKSLRIENQDVYSSVEKVALAIIGNKILHKESNYHSIRLNDNIIKNLDLLVKQIVQKIESGDMKLTDFKQMSLKDFIKLPEKEDLLIIDNRDSKNLKKSLHEQLFDIGTSFIILSKKDIDNLGKYKVLQSKTIKIFSNCIENNMLISKQNNKTDKQLSFDTIENDNIEYVTLKQLNHTQFNSLRQKYLSKQIHFTGTPKVCYGLFSGNKIFGVFGLTNDYYHKPPKDIEHPAVYLMTDFCVKSSINKLSKLVLYCILSKDVKMLAERLVSKEVKSIFTNVFTKHKSSIKYRGLFDLHTRKELEDKSFNLTYISKFGNWTLKEAVSLWKQKL